MSKLWAAYNNGNITKEEIQAERFAVSLRHIEGFTDERIQTINEDYVERIMTKDALVEGAIDLLNYLKPKYRLHILSNGFTEMQYKKMESANIALSYFDNVILSDVAGVNKPHPDIFAYALNKIGANRETVIMIGDNLQTDIIGAYRSGIDQIWFNPDNKESMYIRPTYMVSKLSDIQGIL